jgi:hypothetical protein
MKFWTGLLLILAGGCVVLALCAGCVRPQYDFAMGSACLLAADAFDATTSDLSGDDLKLRDIKLDAAFALVEAKAAASQPVNLTDLERLHQGVRIDQAERAVIAETVRKGRAAANVVRTLGARSQAIGEAEKQFLGVLGVQGDSK